MRIHTRTGVGDTLHGDVHSAPLFPGIPVIQGRGKVYTVNKVRMFEMEIFVWIFL